MSFCKSCGETILWAETPNGKLIPIDPTPGWEGNIRLSEGQDGSRFAEVLTKGSPPSDDRYVTHFKTCPQAAQHRRKAVPR